MVSHDKGILFILSIRIANELYKKIKNIREYHQNILYDTEFLENGETIVSSV